MISKRKTFSFSQKFLLSATSLSSIDIPSFSSKTRSSNSKTDFSEKPVRKFSFGIFQQSSEGLFYRKGTNEIEHIDRLFLNLSFSSAADIIREIFSISWAFNYMLKIQSSSSSPCSRRRKSELIFEKQRNYFFHFYFPPEFENEEANIDRRWFF